MFSIVKQRLKSKTGEGAIEVEEACIFGEIGVALVGIIGINLLELVKKLAKSK